MKYLKSVENLKVTITSLYRFIIDKELGRRPLAITIRNVYQKKNREHLSSCAYHSMHSCNSRFRAILIPVSRAPSVREQCIFVFMTENQHRGMIHSSARRRTHLRIVCILYYPRAHVMSIYLTITRVDVTRMCVYLLTYTTYGNVPERTYVHLNDYM